MYNSLTSQNQYFHPRNTPTLRYVLERSPNSLKNYAYFQNQLRNLGLISTTYYLQSSFVSSSRYLSPKDEGQSASPYNPKAGEFFNRMNNSVTYKNILFQFLPHLSKSEEYADYTEEHQNIFNNPNQISTVGLDLGRLAHNFNISSHKEHSAGLMAVSPMHNIGLQEEETHKGSNELRNWLTSFGAGFCAGTVARTSTAPFDRLKFIYQLYYKGSDKPPTLLKGFQEMYRRDGFRGLFRGNLVCVLKASPETSIRLTIFEKLKSLIQDEKTGKLSKQKLFFAGGLSGALANFAIFPMDMLRTRLAATPAGVYKGIGDAIKKISATEGRIRPFYRGLSAGLIANFPTSGMNLMVYEALKEFAAEKTQSKNPPAVLYMVLAGMSALVTCSALYPLQVVASRQIMQSLLDKENSGKGMIHQIKKTFKAEGWRGFYKGYCPATSKVVLGNAMSFGSYEILKRAFGIEFKKH